MRAAALALALALAAVPVAAQPQAAEPRFVLKGVRFVIEGEPAVGRDALAAAAAPYVGQVVGFAELEALRQAVGRLYAEAGYVASGALLPDQTVADGVVVYRLVEGRLTALRVAGPGIGPGGFGALDPGYVAERLRPDPDRPLTMGAVGEKLRLLLDDPALASLRATVGPGDAPGEATLDVEATARRPWDLSLTLDNSNQPSVGEETATLTGVLRNLIGRGDRVAAEVEVSQGVHRLAAAVEAPLDPGGLTAFAEVEFSRARAVEQPFADLGVESDSNRATVGLRAPLLRTSERRLDVETGFTLEHAETRLLGEGFSFRPGPRDGVSRLSVAHFGAAYVARGPDSTLALRAELSLGLDAFGATRNRDGPDGRYALLVAQAQVARRLAPGLVAIARAQGQLASRALLPLEQVSVGGRDTVRGYREAAAVADQAALATLQVDVDMGRLAVPALTPDDHDATLTLAPFLDLGAAWDKGRRGDAETLAGAGVALRWAPSPAAALSLAWGHALRDLDPGPERRTLQDAAVYVALTLALP